MPRGYRLIDLHDEWVGGPAVATRLVAADYRMTLLGVAADRLEAAVGALLAATRCAARSAARRRSPPTTSGRSCSIFGFARPMPRPGPRMPRICLAAAGLWMRLRHSQELGSGRADEVVAAVADELGMAAIAPPGSGEAEDRRGGRAGPAGRAFARAAGSRDRSTRFANASGFRRSWRS